MLDLEDGCGIRSHRIAHPDPHESIAGNGRVAAYLCNPRDVFRARDTRASAAEVINQPVVAAFDLIINKPTKRQRKLAKHAGILECDGSSSGRPVKHDSVAQHGQGKQCPCDIAIPCNDIPGVPQKHGRSSSRNRKA